jgi:cell wall-associated NlpC family hydrolase
VGMYIGDGEFIHSSGGNQRGRVKIDTIFGGHARYWKNLLHSVRRILPLRPKVLEPR